MKRLFSALTSSRKVGTRVESRCLRLEALEDRQMLDAAGIMSVETQSLEVGAVSALPTSNVITVTIAEDVVDSSDDFNSDGTPNRISLREAFAYIDPDSDFMQIEIGDSVTSPLVLNSEIVIETGDFYVIGGEHTITTSDDVRAFNVGVNAGLTLADLTLDGCGGDELEGGAIYNEGGVAVTRVTFTNNNALKGGAVYSSGEFVASDSVFSANGLSAQTEYGGAIYLSSSAVSSFEGCEFIDNGARSEQLGAEGDTIRSDFTVRGGAIYNAGTIDAISNTDFVGNCGYYGGAVYSKGDALLQDGVELRDNEAFLGGAIYVHAEGDVNATGENIVFTGNKANISDSVTQKHGSGGAVYVSANSSSHGVFKAVGVDFIDNKAAKYGGSIANYGHTQTHECNFDSNLASIGGAVCNASDYLSFSDAFVQNGAYFGEGSGTSESYDWLFSEGGNGGAIYSANNATTGQTSTLTLSGYSSFTENDASRSGGAINVVSGNVKFLYLTGGMFTFENNLSMCGMGGALVFANGLDNVEFYDDGSAPSEVFVFDGNYAWYAPTIGVSAKTGEQMRRFVENFGFDYSTLSPNQVDTFTLYDNQLTNDKLTYEYLAELCHWLSPNGAITLCYTGEGSTGEVTIGPGEEVRLGDLGIPTNSEGGAASGSYKIEFYYGSPDSDPSLEPASKTAFELIVSVTEDEDYMMMRRIEILGYDDYDVVPMTGFSFVNYDCPVEAIMIDWGDGSNIWVSQVESFSTNVYHMFPDKIEWDPESGDPDPNVYTVTADVALVSKKHITVSFQYHAHASSKDWHVRPGEIGTYEPDPDSALLDSAFTDLDLFDV